MSSPGQAILEVRAERDALRARVALLEEQLQAAVVLLRQWETEEAAASILALEVRRLKMATGIPERLARALDAWDERLT